ncbi:hypothetical protein [Bradyrhizobium sp. SZCCHNRI2049]|uniref:hypothetical protein n=1 Tax=Bradyrhizobium sp. SZCCHNRI2049 TaxID=3057287 RepID=UPI002915D0AA|nr:hypothetical protein [Bradyrhizobium sp. SZCCHNRI2049]
MSAPVAIVETRCSDATYRVRSLDELNDLRCAWWRKFHARAFAETTDRPGFRDVIDNLRWEDMR